MVTSTTTNMATIMSIHMTIVTLTITHTNMATSMTTSILTNMVTSIHRDTIEAARAVVTAAVVPEKSTDDLVTAHTATVLTSHTIDTTTMPIVTTITDDLPEKATSHLLILARHTSTVAIIIDIGGNIATVTAHTERSHTDTSDTVINHQPVITLLLMLSKP